MNDSDRETIIIDGSVGEGGGQVLRSALTMAMLSGRGFRIEKIRAGRRRSGLLRQHLTCVMAAQEICQAEVEGAHLGSEFLNFKPGKTRGGDYRFAVGSAGSTMLVLQTVLLPLSLCGQLATLHVSGGTHNPSAPPFEFIERAYLDVLRKAGLKIEAELLRPGYMPAGGGEVVVRMSPPDARPSVELLERGALLDANLEAVVAHLPASIAEREVTAFLSAAPPLPGFCVDWQTEVQRTFESSGPGNALLATLNFEHATEVFFVPGQKKVTAEQVAKALAGQVRAYLQHDAPAGEHLTDQLLVVLAALGEGRFRCGPLSSHARTQLELLPRFTGRSFEVIERDDHTLEVRLESE